MSAKRTRTTIIVITVVAVVSLVFSNYIVAISCGDNQRSTSFSELQSEQDAWGYLDMIEQSMGITDPLRLSGWALCDNQGNLDVETIDIIFERDGKCVVYYDVVPTANHRLPDNFYEKPSVNSQCGFFVSINAFNLPEGVYDIYLRPKAGDSAGMFFTGFRLRRYAGETSAFSPQKVDLSGVLLKQSESLVGCIDSVSKGNDVTTVSGWVFNKDESSITNPMVYILFVDSGGSFSVYETIPFSRTDVASMYGLENDYVGFSISVANTGIPTNCESIKIVYEIDGDYYSSGAVQFPF